MIGINVIIEVLEEAVFHFETTDCDYNQLLRTQEALEDCRIARDFGYDIR